MVEEGNPHHYFMATQGAMPVFAQVRVYLPEAHEASAESFCSIFFLLDPDHLRKHLHPE
uniref:UTP23 small subunit processome component n=1 Tax=Ailuropoda melanoleuca TaxID=9646 RepID=A0A7N5JJ29_AILME